MRKKRKRVWLVFCCCFTITYTYISEFTILKEKRVAYGYEKYYGRRTSNTHGNTHCVNNSSRLYVRVKN